MSKWKLKFGYSEADSKNAFLNELNALKEMSHKHIVRLHEFIDNPAKKKFYLVMDYLEGGSVKDQLKALKTGIDVDKARDYFRQLLSAVHYCHEVKNTVHRDIKPENMMLDLEGNLSLCDFGTS